MPWFRWLLTAFAVVFAVLFLVYVLRGFPLQRATSEALAWGAISAWVYVAARVRNVRRGRHCALCVGPSQDGE